MLGVVDGVDDELSNVVVLQAVEDRRPLPAGSHQARHPQLGEVLRHRRRGFAYMLGEFVDRHLAVGKRPQHLHAGGVSEHPEHLDDQADLIVRQPDILDYLHAYADNSAVGLTLSRTGGVAGR